MSKYTSVNAVIEFKLQFGHEQSSSHLMLWKNQEERASKSLKRQKREAVGVTE